MTEPEVELLAARLRPLLAQGALWLVSEFQVPEGWLRVPGRVLLRGLYGAFRVLTGLRVTSVPDYGRVLRDARLERVGERSGMGGLLTAQLWQVRREGE